MYHTRLTWYRLSLYHSWELCCREATGRHCTELAWLYDAPRIIARWCCQPRSTCLSAVHPGRPLFGRTALKFHYAALQHTVWTTAGKGTLGVLVMLSNVRISFLIVRSLSSRNYIRTFMHLDIFMRYKLIETDELIKKMLIVF